MALASIISEQKTVTSQHDVKIFAQVVLSASRKGSGQSQSTCSGILLIVPVKHDCYLRLTMAMCDRKCWIWCVGWTRTPSHVCSSTGTGAPRASTRCPPLHTRSWTCTRCSGRCRTRAAMTKSLPSSSGRWATATHIATPLLSALSCIACLVLVESNSATLKVTDTARYSHGQCHVAVTTVARPFRNVTLTVKKPQSVLDCSKLHEVIWYSGTALLGSVE